jgi:hypothetical protein
LAALTPTVLNTTENALSRFSPKDRDCYSDGEFELMILNLEQGYRYSIRNCLYESVLEKIMSSCKCLPSYPEIFFYQPLPFCRGENLTCAISWLNLMGDGEHDPDLSFSSSSKHERLKCLQRCQLQTETMLTTTSTYPNKQTFPLRQDFCFLLQKLVFICSDETKSKIFELNHSPSISCKEIISANNSTRICNENDKANTTKVYSNEYLYNFMFNYARNNLAVLKVFIKDPYYTKIKKDEQMTFVAFVGNAGGLAGLCMGLSLVSIFEVFYHCTNVCFDLFVRPVIRKVMPNNIL